MGSSASLLVPWCGVTAGGYRPVTSMMLLVGKKVDARTSRSGDGRRAMRSTRAVGRRDDGVVDARDRLTSDPFDWQRTASGQVRVSRGGRLVAVVAGAAARRLDRVLDGGDDGAIQHALARATGNYKRGNER
jgi:hypothetical protein